MTKAIINDYDEYHDDDYDDHDYVQYTDHDDDYDQSNAIDK